MDSTANNSRGLEKISLAANRIAAYTPPKAAYYIALIIFAAAFIVTSVFHEPWLDEAQAWLIARDATYYDMIFLLPHYEGHPPLWWLILSLPAKAGLPYETSLTIITLIIYVALTCIIFFRSPFCGVIRLLLPFSFYLFYQYGVIARPYGLMTFTLLLAASLFADKDKKPFRFVFSLILLCALSAYGIIISGGIAIAWCVDIAREYGFKRLFTEFIRTRRFFALCLLLISALFLIFLIISNDETFTNDTVPFSLHFFLRGMYYMLLMSPADVLVITGGGLGTLLKYQSFPLSSLILFSIVSALILLYISSLCLRKGKLLYFLIPYILMAAFASAVYFNVHHLGIVGIFLLFILYICCDEKDNRSSPLADAIYRKLPQLTPNVCSLLFSAMLLLPQISWTITAIAADIRYDYYYGRAVAEYIKENELDKLNIMSSWYYEVDPYGYTTVSANKQHIAATILPYFDENIFFNFNYGDPSRSYIFHRMSDEANEEQFALWRETIPDILIGEPRMEQVYSKTDIRRTDYILIKSFEYKQITKNGKHSNYICIYMRNDLFDDHPNIQPENPMDREFIEE